jgi:hypothetical protein
MGALIFLGSVIVGLLLYPVPGFVASYRCHSNEMAIWVLNLFLGWTFVGWVIALVWALTDNVRRA